MPLNFRIAAAVILLCVSAVAADRELVGIAKAGDNSGIDAEWGRAQTMLLKRTAPPENQDIKEHYRSICCAAAGEESAFQPEWLFQLKPSVAPPIVPLFGSIELNEEEFINFRLIRNVGGSEWLVFKAARERKSLPNPLKLIQKFSDLLGDSDEYITSAQLNQLDNLAAQYPPSDELAQLWKVFRADPKNNAAAKSLLARVNTQLEQGVSIYERYGEILAKSQLRLLAQKTRKMNKPEPPPAGFTHKMKKAEKGTREMLVCNITGLKLPEAVDKLIETFRNVYQVNLEKPEIPKDLHERLIEDLSLEFEKSNDVWKMLGTEVEFRYERRAGVVHFIDAPSTKKK